MPTLLGANGPERTGPEFWRCVAAAALFFVVVMVGALVTCTIDVYGLGHHELGPVDTWWDCVTLYGLVVAAALAPAFAGVAWFVVQRHEDLLGHLMLGAVLAGFVVSIIESIVGFV